MITATDDPYALEIGVPGRFESSRSFTVSFLPVRTILVFFNAGRVLAQENTFLLNAAFERRK